MFLDPSVIGVQWSRIATMQHPPEIPNRVLLELQKALEHEKTIIKERNDIIKAVARSPVKKKIVNDDKNENALRRRNGKTRELRVEHKPIGRVSPSKNKKTKQSNGSKEYKKIHVEINSSPKASSKTRRRPTEGISQKDQDANQDQQIDSKPHLESSHHAQGHASRDKNDIYSINFVNPCPTNCGTTRSPAFLTAKARAMHCEIDEPDAQIYYSSRNSRPKRRGFVSKLLSCFGIGNFKCESTSRDLIWDDYQSPGDFLDTKYLVPQFEPHIPQRDPLTGSYFNPNMEPLRCSLPELPRGQEVNPLGEHEKNKVPPERTLHAENKGVVAGNCSHISEKLELKDQTADSPLYCGCRQQTPSPGEDNTLNISRMGIHKRQNSLDSIIVNMSDGEAATPFGVRRHTPIPGSLGKPRLKLRKRKSRFESCQGKETGKQDDCSKTNSVKFCVSESSAKKSDTRKMEKVEEMRKDNLPSPSQKLGQAILSPIENIERPALKQCKDMGVTKKRSPVKHTKVSILQLANSKGASKCKEVFGESKLQDVQKCQIQQLSKTDASSKADSDPTSLHQQKPQQNIKNALEEKVSPIKKKQDLHSTKKVRSAPVSLSSSPVKPPRMTKAAEARLEATKRLMELRRQQEMEKFTRLPGRMRGRGSSSRVLLLDENCELEKYRSRPRKSSVQCPTTCTQVFGLSMQQEEKDPCTGNSVHEMQGLKHLEIERSSPNEIPTHDLCTSISNESVMIESQQTSCEQNLAKEAKECSPDNAVKRTPERLEKMPLTNISEEDFITLQQSPGFINLLDKLVEGINVDAEEIYRAKEWKTPSLNFLSSPSTEEERNDSSGKMPDMDTLAINGKDNNRKMLHRPPSIDFSWDMPFLSKTEVQGLNEADGLEGLDVEANNSFSGSMSPLLTSQKLISIQDAIRRANEALGRPTESPDKIPHTRSSTTLDSGFKKNRYAQEETSNTLLAQLLDMERSLTVDDLHELKMAIKREGTSLQ